MSPLVPNRIVDRAWNWRRTFEYPFPVDAWDPVSRFIRDRMGWDWPQIWFFALLLYGPIEKLLLPWLGGYLRLGIGADLSTWRPDIEALLTGFVEFPFFLAFYIWTGRGIGELFQSLARNRSFSDEQRYAEFRDRAAASYDRFLWTVLSVVIALIVIVLMQFVNWSPNAAITPWFEDIKKLWWPRLISLGMIGLVGYALAQILIREILTIVWLRRMWNELHDDLVVHPYHGDGAGGLGAIGQHAANFAAFVMMITLFFIMATLLPKLRDPSVTLQLWSPLIVLIWLLYATLVPVIFLVLIWPPHSLMVRIRQQRLTRIAEQIETQVTAAESNAADTTQLPASLQRIDQLRSIRSILQELPTWPLNAVVLRQIRLSSLLPIVYSLLTLGLDWLARR